MSSRKEFGPSNTLRTLWLVSAFTGSNFLGGVFALFGLAFDVNPGKTFLLGAVIGFIISAAYLLLYFETIKYEIDDEYIIKSGGVLWKVRRSTPLDKITNIDVRQGPVERFLGFGQIWIFTPSTGSHTPEEMLLGVKDPHEMKQLIIDYCKRAKKEPRTPGPSPAPTDNTDQQTVLLKEILTTLKAIKESLDKTR